MSERRRFKNSSTLQQRLVDQAERSKKAAEGLALGPDREQLLDRARQFETASDVDKWLSSPGLRPPT
jgi:hypothetical protein